MRLSYRLKSIVKDSIIARIAITSTSENAVDL